MSNKGIQFVNRVFIFISLTSKTNSDPKRYISRKPKQKFNIERNVLGQNNTRVKQTFLIQITDTSYNRVILLDP